MVTHHGIKWISNGPWWFFHLFDGDLTSVDGDFQALLGDLPSVIWMVIWMGYKWWFYDDPTMMCDEILAAQLWLFGITIWGTQKKTLASLRIWSIESLGWFGLIWDIYHYFRIPPYGYFSTSRYPKPVALKRKITMIWCISVSGYPCFKKCTLAFLSGNFRCYLTLLSRWCYSVQEYSE